MSKDRSDKTRADSNLTAVRGGGSLSALRSPAARASRNVLWRGTTLSGGIAAVALLLVPSFALAQNECGVPVANVVDCSPLGPTVSTGIAYVPGATPEDLTVNLGEGQTIDVNADFMPAVLVVGSESVTVSGDNASIISNGNFANGLMATAAQNVTVSFYAVKTNGEGAAAILASGGADVNVAALSVTTMGENAGGIIASSSNPDQALVNVSAAFVATNGDRGNGIVTQNLAVEGDTRIDAYSIATTGDGSYGIFATGAGDISVSSANIHTEGDLGKGIVVSGSGKIDVESKDIATDGAYADGIATAAENDETIIKSGIISTTGAESNGIVAQSVQGNITVSSEEITTSGDFSYGIAIYSYAGHATPDAPRENKAGAITVTAGNITTNGAGTNGIRVQSGAEYGGAFGNHVSITADNISAMGYYSAGILAAGSSVDVTVNDSVNAWGNGVVAIGSEAGGVQVHNLGSIVAGNGFGITAGGDSDMLIDGGGHVSTTGEGATGISSFTSGNITINQDTISTKGYLSFGIDAFIGSFGEDPNSGQNIGVNLNGFTPIFDPSRAQKIAIDINTLTTIGDLSVGISARDQASSGIIDIGVHDTVATSGLASIGIVATGQVGGTANIDVNNVFTRGIYAAGIFVEDGTANINVAGTVSTTGDAAPGIATNSVYTNVKNTGTILASGADSDAILASGQLINVTNTGVISAIQGYALDFIGLESHVENSGSIEGRVRLTEGEDIINNDGTFSAAGLSDFGAGDDNFINTGLFNLGGDGATPVAATLTNLETFENDGLVDLGNGHTGDVLSLSGDFKGGAGSRLAMDIAPGSADQLVIGGTATGKTVVTLQGVDARTSVLSNPVLLIQAGSSSDADAFSIGNGDIGLIHYGLKYIDGTGFALLPTAGAPVYHALHVSEGAGALWFKGSDAWSAQMVSTRDLPGGGDLPQGRVWAQVYGRADTREDDGLNDFNIESKQDAGGVQFGAELARKESDGGLFAFGLTGGYGSVNYTFEASPEKATSKAVNVGAYVTLTHGRYFFDALASASQQSSEINDPVNGYSDSFDGTTVGLKTELGIKFGKGMFRYEPIATLGYARTGGSNLQALGQTLAFDDAETLRGTLGWRISGQAKLGSGAIVYHATLAAVHDFLGQTGLNFYSGEFNQKIQDDAREDFGRQIDLGVSYQARDGFTIDAAATGEYSKNYSSVGGRLGVRYRF